MRQALWRHMAERRTTRVTEKRSVPWSAGVPWRLVAWRWGCLLASMAVLPGTGAGVSDRLLRVEVVDQEAGNPIENAQVHVEYVGGTGSVERHLTADRVGRVEIPNCVLYWERLRISVWSSEFAPKVKMTNRDKLPDRMTFELKEGVAVGGSVLDRQGEPVGDARVYIERISGGKGNAGFPKGRHFEKTNAAGRWTCGHIPESWERFQIRVLHLRYAPRVIGIGVPEGNRFDNVVASRVALEKGIACILNRGYSVHGKVVDGSGKPVEGAKVAGAGHPVWTAEDGRFKISHVPQGKLTLLVTRGGFEPWRRSMTVGPDLGFLKVQLRQARPVTVRVIDQKERPIPKATVAAVEREGTGFRQARWLSNDRGEVVWASPPTREVLISVRKSGYYSERARVDPKSSGETTIRLKPRLKIRGSVTEAGSNEPIETFRIIPGHRHEDHFHWHYESAKSERDGCFEMSFVEHDHRHGIRVEADNYFPTNLPAFPKGAGSKRVEVLLTPGSPFEGRIESPSGEAVSGARVVVLTKSQGALLSGLNWKVANGRRLTSSTSEGTFKLPPLHDVIGLAVVHEKGYAEIRLDQFQKKRLIGLKRWGAVSGKVAIEQDSSSQNLIAIKRVGEMPVRLHRNRWTKLARPDKSFHFGKVPPGKYRVGMMIDSRLSHPKVVQVEPGRECEVILGKRQASP